VIFLGHIMVTFMLWSTTGIDFKNSCIGRRVHGYAPHCLWQFTLIANTPSRQSLRSSSSNYLLVPAVGLPTIGHHAFLITSTCTWNDPPVDVTSTPSLLTFRKLLKLHLFRLSYPGLVF